MKLFNGIKSRVTAKLVAPGEGIVPGKTFTAGLWLDTPVDPGSPSP